MPLKPDSTASSTSSLVRSFFHAVPYIIRGISTPAIVLHVRNWLALVAMLLEVLTCTAVVRCVARYLARQGLAVPREVPGAGRM